MMEGWDTFRKNVFGKENNYDEWTETEKAFHAGAQSAYYALKNGMNVSEEDANLEVIKWAGYALAKRIRANSKNMDKLAKAILDSKGGET